MAQTMTDKIGAEEKLSEDSRNTGQRENGDNKKLGPLSRNIIPHLINIYTCLATPRDLEIYHPDATFEDFFVRAFGIKEIKSIHYSFPKLVYDGKIIEYTLEENETSPGCGEILFNITQQYKVLYLGKEVNLTTLMVLQIENGKIVKHEDRINQNPVRDRHNIGVPLVGRVREGIRRLTMLMLHLRMGFGKDPTP